MDIGNELGLIFCESLTEIVSTFSGFSLDVQNSAGTADGKDNVFYDMTGVMGLNGKKSGVLLISINEKDIRLLCSYMIGVPLEEVTRNDVDDALCELVNMTAGSAKLRLSGSEYVFNLSSSFVLRSHDMYIVAKNKTHIISKVLGNGEISIKLKVVY
ncbi:MAG: chemotaxis protein CheX [Treponema sp.]|nr:chemotaxis protein CheX [Treponema sp.]